MRYQIKRPTRRAVAFVAAATLAIGVIGGAASSASAASSHGDGFTFDTQSAPLASGLYQVAYSERNDVLWATSAVGRPPITQSALQKIDPNTLEVLATYTPPKVGAGTADDPADRVEAVYGVSVDDVNNTVWTTATRESIYGDGSGKVAIYDQATGAYITNVPVSRQSRDIVIDTIRGFAYVSDPFANLITKINTTTYATETIDLGADSSPMSLELISDENTSLLYTVSLYTGRVYEIDNLGQSVRVVGNSGGARASGIAVDLASRQAFISSQDSADVIAMSLDTGATTRTVAPAGLLNSALDSANGLVFHTAFWGSEVFVTSAVDNREIARIPVGATPNHVIVAKGAVFVVDKSGAGAGGVDQLWKITTTPTNAPSPQPTDPGIPSPQPTDPTVPVDPTKPVVPAPLPATAQVSFDDQSDVVPGETVTISGSGFTPGQQLAVKIDRDAYGMIRENGAQVVDARITVDENGAFAGEPITVPLVTDAGAETTAGWHTLHLLDSSPVTAVTVPFKTAAAATSAISADKLTDATKDLVTAPASAAQGETLALTVAPTLTGRQFGAWLGDRFLGWSRVGTGGAVSFAVPTDATAAPAGALVLTDWRGGLYSWSPIAITGTGVPPVTVDTGQIEVLVAVPQGAGLSISVANDSVDLGETALSPSIKALVAAGTLPEITVTDMRASNPGWSLTGTVSDFAGSNGSIGARYLGWAPEVRAAADGQTVTQGAVVTPGDGLETAAVLASAGAGAGAGTAKVAAGLTLEAPTSTPVGQYTAVLTLTLS